MRLPWGGDYIDVLSEHLIDLIPGVDLVDLVDLDLIAGKGGFGEVCACQTRATGKM